MYAAQLEVVLEQAGFLTFWSYDSYTLNIIGNTKSLLFMWVLSINIYHTMSQN